METLMMLILWLVVLAAAFWWARGMMRDVTWGIPAVLFFLALVAVMAYAWFHLLSSLLVPLSLLASSSSYTYTSTLAESYRAMIVYPALFRFAWAVVALVLVVVWRKGLMGICDALVGSCALSGWEQVGMLAAMAGLLQQLLILPQQLVFDLLRVSSSASASPLLVLGGINAVVALLLVLALILARRSQVESSGEEHG